MICNNLPVSRKKIKSDARRLLTNHRLLLKLIFGIFLYIAVTIIFDVMWDYAFSAVSYFFRDEKTADIASVISSFVAIIPKFLMTAPLFMGMWHIAIKSTNGQNPDFIEIFGYYTWGNIGRAYKTMAILQLPVAFLSATTAIPKLFFAKLSLGSLICDLIYLLLLFVIALFVVGRLFPFINSVICGGDQPVFLCLKASLAATRGKSLSLLGFILSFTPWILLSLVTVGTLFIIFTFPYMMVAVSLYSSYLLTGEYRTQILEETL